MLCCHAHGYGHANSLLEALAVLKNQSGQRSKEAIIIEYSKYFEFKIEALINRYVELLESNQITLFNLLNLKCIFSSFFQVFKLSRCKNFK